MALDATSTLKSLENMDMKQRLFLSALVFLYLASPIGGIVSRAENSVYTGTPSNTQTSFELLSMFGGLIQAVSISGNFAYIGTGSILTILDISDPSHPVKVGKTEMLGGEVRDIAVAGNRAYVVVGHPSFQLLVVDVSNPAYPIVQGSSMVMCNPWRVLVSGNYIYVADNLDGMKVFSVSDPFNPTLVGSIDTPGAAKDIAVFGNYAYVADVQSGLRIIDISNPANPSEVGSIDTPGNAVGVVVQGNYTFVADGESGLRIINISDPAHPTDVGSYNPGSFYANDVTISGQYVYLALGWCGGLQVVNVTDPLHPTAAGQFTVPGKITEFKTVTLSGSYAFVADKELGLHIINVSNPENLTEVSIYLETGNAKSLSVIDSTLYIAAGSSGLRIINASDPLNLVEVGYYNPNVGEAYDVAVAGNYAYVADSLVSLRVIDISNPQNPTQVGSIGNSARSVVVAGSYAYVGDYGSFMVVNISDPSNPIETGFLSLPGNIGDVAVSGNYAFLANNGYGLSVVNISDPTLPTESSLFELTYDNGWDSAKIVIAGNYAYYAVPDIGVHIFDISDPLNLQEISFYPTWSMGIAVSGDLFFVANPIGEIRAVSVSDPANPTKVGNYRTSAAFDVVVAGNLVYLYDWWNGIYLLEVTQTSESLSQVSGRITDSQGNPLSGVTVTDNMWSTSITDNDGNYILSNMRDGPYSITASRERYSFSPGSIIVTVPPDASQQNFIGSPDQNLIRIVSSSEAPSVSSDWLDRLNDFRSLANLPPVIENIWMSEGSKYHARYMVKEDELGHNESLSSIWFSVEGEEAARGNVTLSSNVQRSDLDAIESWMAAPFHGIGMIDPSLQIVGYGSYREADGGDQMGATLDIQRGIVSIPATVSFPIMWPADGKTVPLLSFLGGETPDPLTSCPGYAAPTGIPIYLQLGSGDLIPNVISHSFTQEGGIPLEHCIFDETSYVNPNSYDQSTGRAVLQRRNAIILIPRQPLTLGTSYTVSITVNAQSYVWSFATREQHLIYLPLIRR